MTDLLLQRASVSWPGADGHDDYDVIGIDGLVSGRNRAQLPAFQEGEPQSQQSLQICVGIGVSACNNLLNATLPN